MPYNWLQWPDIYINHMYKATSIISRTAAVVWSKTNSGPTGHSLEVVSFRACAPFPELLQFLKCILEVVCSVRVFSTG